MLVRGKVGVSARIKSIPSFQSDVCLPSPPSPPIPSIPPLLVGTLDSWIGIMAYLVSPLIGGARMEAVGTPASPPRDLFVQHG